MRYYIFLIILFICKSYCKLLEMDRRRINQDSGGRFIFRFNRAYFRVTYCLFINLPLTDIGFKFVSQILPLFFTVIIGYLGFQVGFRRREEFMGILTRNRKDKRKDNVEIEPETKSGVQVKILDTSVIIDGRIADVIQTHFLEGTIVIPQFVLGELQ